MSSGRTLLACWVLAALWNIACSAHAGKSTSLSWFLHLSDIHLSEFDEPSDPRLQDLMSFSQNVLERVKPNAVLVTGDLPDSKTKFKRAQQRPKEWVMYQKALKSIANATDLGWDAILDIRGNHDAFDVPIRMSEGDFYSKNSASGEHWGLSRVKIDPLYGKGGKIEGNKGEGCPVGLFVGVDASPSPGLRGPTNFVGVAGDGLVSELDRKLKQALKKYNANACSPVLIGYGHYPLSLVASPDWDVWHLLSQYGGNKVKDVLLKYGVSTWLCGHLHDKFGLRLHKIHKSATSVLAELETADWKFTRRFRVMGVDNGAVSFIDLQYVSNGTNGGYEIDAVEKSVKIGRHIVLMTTPASAYYSPLGVNPVEGPPNNVRALVFALSDIGGKDDYSVWANWSCVKTGVNGSMQMSKGDGDFVYEAEWKLGMQCGDNDSMHVQIVVKNGQQIDSTSEVRLIHASRQETPIDYPHSFIEWFTLTVDWSNLIRGVFLCLWGAHVSLILVIPKILATKRVFTPPGYGCIGNRYERVGDIVRESCLNGNGSRRRLSIWQWCLKTALSPIQILTWASHATSFWYGQLAYALYALIGPWAVVRAMSDEPLALLFYYGIFSPNPKGGAYTFINIPDSLMVSVVHYAFTILPSSLWVAWVISHWQARTSALRSQWSCLTHWQMVSGGILAFLHYGNIEKMAIWYGPVGVLLSPAVSWWSAFCAFWLYSARREIKKMRTD